MIEVDNPRECFATLDCHNLESDKLTFRVPDSPESADPEWVELTVEFEIPKSERRAAALTELYNYSVEADERPFDPELVYKTDWYELIADHGPKAIGHECVKGDKAGYVVIPPVEIVRVPLE